MTARPGHGRAFAEGRRSESATHVQVASSTAARPAALADRGRRLDVLTVPLGALGEAYLDALARLEADRLGNVSSSVAIAGQLIPIKRSNAARPPASRPG